MAQDNAIKIILNRLLDDGHIDEVDYNELYNKYLSTDGLNFIPINQSDVTNSTDMNTCLLDLGIDISNLFASYTDIENTINKHYKLNEAIINSIKLENGKIIDRINRSEKLIKNRTLHMINETFRDSSSFNLNTSEYTYTKVFFDKYIKGIKLNYINSINALISNTGSKLGNIDITRQHSSLLGLTNNITNISNAIDNNRNTYWHECISVSEPIKIEYKGINNGAVCELLITLNSLTDINEISLSPFSEFPMQLIEISYTDDDKTYNVISDTLVNFSDTIMYQFKNIKIKRLKVLLNQIHYKHNTFITKTDDLKANGIFITDNNKQFIDEILKPVKNAITDGTFEIQLNKQNLYIDKLQYEYGLYNISVCNNDYNTIGEYVSVPYQFLGLSTIVLDTNEEHYILDNTKTTSIEYYLIVNNIQYPLLPINTTKIEAELLTPFLENDKTKATLRFNLDTSDIINNVLVYKDGQLLEFGINYVVKDNNIIEFIEYDTYAKYTVDYLVEDIDTYIYHKIPWDNEVAIDYVDIKIKTILKQNSRYITGVTPILYEYSVIATDVPVEYGHFNSVASIEIIPNEIHFNMPYKLPIQISGDPILKSITIDPTPIRLRLTDKCELNEYND